MPLLFLLTLFLVADFVALFVIGAKIGLLLSLLWIIVSAAFGLHLIRRESLLTVQRARERLARHELPSEELMAGAAFALAGILLIAPGFLSDILGLICLLPGSGELARRWFGKPRRQFHRGNSATAGPHADSNADWQQAGQRKEDATSSEEAPGRGQPSETPIEGDYLGKNDTRRG